eukprot:13016059-Alexandrium_andersonii.AAC.1
MTTLQIANAFVGYPYFVPVRMLLGLQGGSAPFCRASTSFGIGYAIMLNVYLFVHSNGVTG